MRNKIIGILAIVIFLIGVSWLVWNNMQFAKFIDSLPKAPPLSISDIQNKLCFGNTFIEIYKCEYNIYMNPAIGTTSYFDSQGNRIGGCGLHSTASPCKYLQKLKCESENICEKGKTTEELSSEESSSEELPPQEFTEEDITSWNSYTSEKYRFDIKIPSNLEAREKSNDPLYGNGVVFWGDSPDAVPFAITVETNTEKLSLKEWFDSNIKAKDNVEEIEINGYRAIKWTTFIERYYVSREDKIYRLQPIEGSALTDEEIIRKFSKILSTFRFLE